MSSSAAVSRSSIKVKGVRDGLLITLGEGPWEEVRAALFALLEAQSAFFQGARVALDVGERALRAAELGKLRDELSERGITLWAVLSSAPRTQANAQALGLATRLFTPAPRPSRRQHKTSDLGEEALLVPRTLRSGMRVEYPGHVVVLGHVHPGAEIVAGGHVIVWGKLRGLVHAGAEGNEQAVVCALELAPTQLRIASVIATMPPQEGPTRPEKAYLKDGQVVAEPWNP